MKTTREFLKEQDLKENVVFSFGRFQTFSSVYNIKPNLIKIIALSD